jgi:hypothetical protein
MPRARRSPRARRRRGSVSGSWWCVMAGGGSGASTLVFPPWKRGSSESGEVAGQNARWEAGNAVCSAWRGLATNLAGFMMGGGGYFSFVPMERDAVGQWELQPTSSPTNRRLMFGRHRRKAARRWSRLSRACTGVWAVVRGRAPRSRRCEAMQ